MAGRFAGFSQSKAPAVVGALGVIVLISAAVAVAASDDPTSRKITTDTIRGIGAEKDGIYRAGDMMFLERHLDYADIHLNGFVGGGRWPGGVVYYTFSSAIDENNRQMFRDAAQWWSDVSSLRFFESATATNRIVVESPIPSRCSSYVGMTGGVQTLNLGSECWSKGTIAHEIGHAVGFFHEQTRPDRASHVTIVTTGGGAPACNDLITVNWGIQDGLPVSSYDFGSVMHYRSYSTLQSRDCRSGVSGLITAISAQPPGLPSGSEGVCESPGECTAIMGSRSGLSARDGYAMARRYGHRIEVSSIGNGVGTFAAIGHFEVCGTGCYHVTPDSFFRVNATPSIGSRVRISGECSGQQACQFSPSINGAVRISFIKENSLTAVATVVRSVVVDDADSVFVNGFDAVHKLTISEGG